MLSSTSLLTLVHLVGLVLAVGAATVKLALLLKSGADPSLVPFFLRVTRTVTRLIIVGIGLLVASGVGWLLIGYPMTPLLVTKLVLVAAVLVMGPVIDNVVEPRYRAHAPTAGAPVSAEFVAARRRYVVFEAVATALFYAVTVLWVLR